jgi:hypothetical protein
MDRPRGSPDSPEVPRTGARRRLWRWPAPLVLVGHPVTAVDRDVSGVTDLAATRGSARRARPRDGRRPSRAGGSAVVVTNYLYRPILADLAAAVADGGLLYDSQSVTNTSAPTNPDSYAAANCSPSTGRLRVVAYEDVVVTSCARRRSSTPATRSRTPDDHA